MVTNKGKSCHSGHKCQVKSIHIFYILIHHIITDHRFEVCSHKGSGLLLGLNKMHYYKYYPFTFGPHTGDGSWEKGNVIKGTTIKVAEIQFSNGTVTLI